jgi:hypothetical protein
MCERNRSVGHKRTPNVLRVTSKNIVNQETSNVSTLTEQNKIHALFGYANNIIIDEVTQHVAQRHFEYHQNLKKNQQRKKGFIK